MHECTHEIHPFFNIIPFFLYLHSHFIMEHENPDLENNHPQNPPTNEEEINPLSNDEERNPLEN